MKRLGMILTFTFIASMLNAAYLPTDAERARWTMSDFRTIATAAAAYKVDHGAYPAAKSIDELQKLVQPIYVKSLPTRDAWGNALRYVSDGKVMTIVSAGADGAFNEASWGTPAKWMQSFSEDAVWTDGSFTRNWEYK